MAKYSVIDSNGTIVNIIQWDGKSAWTPPEDYTVRLWRKGDHFGTPDAKVLSRREARLRAIAAIKANKDQVPYGKILYDLAIAIGIIEAT